MNAEQRNELDGLAQAGGGLLRAEAVVEFASDPETALYAAFTWDDTEAAHLHRLNEARQLIRVYVIREPVNHRKVRAYISVPTDRLAGGGYRPVGDVLKHPDWQAAIVAEAVEKIASLARTYAHLRQLDPLWERLRTAAEAFVAERAANKSAS